MRIDLHTHSTASDGTVPPREVVAEAARAGLDVVALTDHDTSAGWAEAVGAVATAGVALVRGIEVSTWTGPVSVHLLAYLVDPAEPRLAAELERIRTSRQERARTMVRRMSTDLPITWEDVLAVTEPGAVVGRPHIADALVARGVVPDRDAAFVHLLAADGPYHVRHHAPTTVQAVGLVRRAGGVPVLAHPAAVGRGRALSDAAMEELVDAGLAGLEVHHRDHSPDQVARLAALAARRGLLVTGSSDYHGRGRANALGERTTDPAVLAAIEARGALEVVRP